MRQRVNLRSPLFVQYNSRPAEAASTNLYLRSQELSTSPNSDVNLNVSTNSYEAPDGTNTAEYFTSSTNTSTSKYLQQNVSIATSAKKHTLSIYVKGKTERYLTLQVLDSGYNAWINSTFDLLNGTVSYEGYGESSIEYISNGWYRCSVTAYPSASGTGRIRIKILNASKSGVGLLLWGAQLEKGPLSSYIPTTSTSASRSATTTADTSEATAEIKVWSGRSGYAYDRTNSQVYSQDFSQSAWTKTRCTVTSDDAIAPDGTLTATRLTGDGTGDSYVYDGVGLSFDDLYAFSIFVKKINSSIFKIRVFGNVATVEYDLDNLTTSTTSSQVEGAKIQDFGNGWLRCSAVINPSSSASTSIGYGNVTYNGDAFYIWGAQTEYLELATEGSATDYIPTTSSPATEDSYTDESPSSATYSLSNSPINGKTTFELSQLIRDYIEQTNIKNSGTVWVKVSILDGVQLPKDYTFLATEGYISSYEPIQTYINSPSSDVFMQSNGSVIVAENETLSVPVYSNFNSYYTKTTSGVTSSPIYFCNSSINNSQIEYIEVGSDDDSLQLYIDSVLTDTVSIEKAECSKYANNRLMFVNKFGAKQEFFVNMKSIEKIKVKDNGFNRNVINYDTLTIDNGIHGYKRNVSETREMFTLNTPFLDEGNVQAFEELLLSEYVWMSRDGSDYTPVTIKDNSMTRKTHLNDKLIQYTINVESSFNLINNQR